MVCPLNAIRRVFVDQIQKNPAMLPPLYYDHFFWPEVTKAHIFSFLKTLLIRPFRHYNQFNIAGR